MSRLIASLIAVLALIPASAGAFAAQEGACADFAAYLVDVDAAIGEGLASLDRQPGFREDFASGIEASEANGAGFLALSPEQQDALVAYLRMPGVALAAMDEDSVPDMAREIHDSAIDYWTLMPNMMEAIADESPSAAMPFYEDLDTASRANVAAQEVLLSACPDEVTAWEEAYRSLFARESGTPEADLVTLWDRHKDDGAPGLGYPFLFFASEENDPATPAAGTPQIIRTTV